MVASFGEQEWIPQAEEGVARLVTLLAQQQGTVANPPPLDQGGQYNFPPVAGSMAQVQAHVQQNPAAAERHLAAPQNPLAVHTAQAAYEAAQQQYAAAMAAQSVPQQVAGLQAAGAGLQEFAELAGVQDPTLPPAPPATPQIIMPPGVQRDEPDPGAVSRMW